MLMSVDVKQELLLPSRSLDGGDTSITTADKFAIVSASKSGFLRTASSLTELKECPFPNTDVFGQLLAYEQRLTKTEAQQHELDVLVAELRLRSANVAAQYYQKVILGGGEQWLDWEERLVHIEQKIRRKEVSQATKD